MKYLWTALVLLLLTQPAAAQSNFVYGTQEWPAVLLVPHPEWFMPGLDDIQDEWCQVNTQVFNTSWGGNQNQIVFTCVGVPNPATGVWMSKVVLRGFSGHNTGTYFGGYELGVEGKRDPITGIESVNRFLLYRYAEGTHPALGVFDIDMINDTFSFSPNVYLRKSLDAPAGWISGQAFRLYPTTLPTCNESQRRLERWVDGVVGVTGDKLYACSKDTYGNYGWRLLF